MILQKSDHLNVSFPIQESFSNISQQQKLGAISIKCPTHPRYDLTNICMSQGCVEPLCPECFKHHLKIHNEIQTHCNAETILSMRENCQENVQNLLNEFMNEKQRLHGWLDKKVFPHEEILRKIKVAKENLLNMIYKFFEFIEKSIDSYVMSYKTTHSQEFDNLSNKIHEWIEELQLMQIELNGPEYIKCMLKMLMQGFNADLENLKKNISDAFESWDNNSSNYTIDETKLYSINLELMKYIRINEDNGKSPEIKLTTQGNLVTSRNEMNKLNMMNKENNEPFDKYKNFQNFLEYTMKSPPKRNKLPVIPQETFEKTSNQKDILVNDYQLSKVPLGSVMLEQTNENRLRFETNNYFNDITPNKYLCFFQDNSKKFHYLDMISLENKEIKHKFTEKELLIDFKIPLYHRSIITPQGEIYLMGGIDPYHKNQAIGKTYYLDLKIPALIPRTSMLQARYSHSVACVSKYIFVVGGVFDINDGYLNNFEKYDVDFGEWIQLVPCNIKSMGSSLCNYKDKILYKFGGKMDNNGFSNYIEKYDIYKNFWTFLSIDSMSKNCKLPSFNNSYQINNFEILVFGGNINDNQSRSCFLLKIKEYVKNDLPCYEEKIREIKMEINAPGSFWVQPIMHENVLFNIQNIVIEKGKELCHFGKKRILICNSEIWKDL